MGTLLGSRCRTLPCRHTRLPQTAIQQHRSHRARKLLTGIHGVLQPRRHAVLHPLPRLPGPAQHRLSRPCQRQEIHRGHTRHLLLAAHPHAIPHHHERLRRRQPPFPPRHPARQRLPHRLLPRQLQRRHVIRQTLRPHGLLRILRTKRVHGRPPLERDRLRRCLGHLRRTLPAIHGAPSQHLPAALLLRCLHPLLTPPLHHAARAQRPVPQRTAPPLPSGGLLRQRSAPLLPSRQTDRLVRAHPFPHHRRP